jgi:exonuclease SbcC
MSGSNTQIDTIFLDEGFGTLDSESLDKVLASLEQLKASGKLIGIISHVEQLRERISQNIRVSKKGNTGISTIEPHPAVSVG